MVRISVFFLPAIAGNVGRAREAIAATEDDISAAPLLPLLMVELLLLKLDVLPSSIKPLPELLLPPPKPLLEAVLELRDRAAFPLILLVSGEGIPPSKKPTLLLASILRRLEAVDDI